MYSRLQKLTFYQIIQFIFLFAFINIFFLLLFFSSKTDYPYKKIFMFSNNNLLILDFLILFIIFFLWKKYNKIFLKISNKINITNLVLFGTIFLFLGQVFLSYNIYFLTGWDAGGVLIPTAKTIAGGNSVAPFNYYYSVYPNNSFLACCFSILLKINSKIGILDTLNGLMFIITVNCLISSFSGFLTFKCVEKMSNKKWAFFSWIIYVLLIGTSPWLVITYSDSFALFLPILIFFIYTRTFSNKFVLLKWFLIGLISFLGFHIKPQVIIIFIAIFIIEIHKFFSMSFNKKKITSFILIALLFSFLSSKFIYSTAINQIGFNINHEKTLSISHFFMMGLNPKTYGGYNVDDVSFSQDLTTYESRTKGNIKIIKQRLQKFGLFGYIKFLAKKSLVNYNDGTFAWGVEGGFYSEIYPPKNTWISPLLRSFYYTNGSNYNKTSTFEQAIWILVLFSLLGLIFLKKFQLNNYVSVLMLSLLGLTAFELLFEARARYLYIYSPIYICLATLGLKSIKLKISQLNKTNYIFQFIIKIYKNKQSTIIERR